MRLFPLHKKAMTLLKEAPTFPLLLLIQMSTVINPIPHPTLNIIVNAYCICPITLIISHFPMLCLSSFSIFLLVSERIAPVLSLLPWGVILAFTVADSIWLAISRTFYKS